MTSIYKAIDFLSNLVGTDRLENHEQDFIIDIAFKTNDGLELYQISSDEMNKLKTLYQSKRK